MKFLVWAVTLAVTATAFSLPRVDQITLGVEKEAERYLIELSPDITRWVTEDEKWALRRVRKPGNGSYFASGLGHLTLRSTIGGDQFHGYYEWHPWRDTSYIEEDCSGIPEEASAQ